MADEKVYKIPILLFIGWRGEILRGKQIKDEPQHTKQGKITEKTLKLLGIKYKILNSSSNLSLEIKKMKKLAIKNSCPTALLIRKKIFSSSKISLNKKTNLTFNREKALKILRSRLYEYERKKLEDERSKDRKSKIGTGDRSERIRTYNFPQGRVTDHRINLTLHKLEEFMQGEIFDEVIENLNLQAQEEQLENLK